MIRILEYGKIKKEEIFKRSEYVSDVSEAVANIIRNVREYGDKALLEYTEKFDKVVLDSIEVTPEEIAEAFETVDEQFINVINEAAENIRDFHKRQIRNGFIISEQEGIVTGQKVTPIEKVGLYVPGGTAAYPSTVLMDSIPAKLAGCPQIVMVTPPLKNGKVAPEILAAAKISGIDRIYKIGGAQAVAALAYGTETVLKVDKIVGPGNAFVAEAKKQVFGQVSIDMIAGPSEILIIADGKSNPRHIAADLLSQAEHDKNASAVLVTDSIELAKKVQIELDEQLNALPRREIAQCSVENNGKIIVTDNLRDAVNVSNELAPEHLELMVDDPFDLLAAVTNAGSVFMGRNCPEALGDYFAGPNHTLPTGGTAKFSSPLSVDDFTKKTQFTYYTEKALKKCGKQVEYFAKKEGLCAHANSVTVRIEE